MTSLRSHTNHSTRFQHTRAHLQRHRRKLYIQYFFGLMVRGDNNNVPAGPPPPYHAHTFVRRPEYPAHRPDPNIVMVQQTGPREYQPESEPDSDHDADFEVNAAIQVRGNGNITGAAPSNTVDLIKQLQEDGALGRQLDRSSSITLNTGVQVIGDRNIIGEGLQEIARMNMRGSAPVAVQQIQHTGGGAGRGQARGAAQGRQQGSGGATKTAGPTGDASKKDGTP